MATEEAQPVGRPTLYDPSTPKVAAAMAKMGATDADISIELGISLSTFYVWRSKYKEFMDAIKTPKKEVDERVERALLQRATGYQLEVEKLFHFQGQITKVKTIEHIPADPKCAHLWLRNRKAETWGADGNEKPTEDACVMPVPTADSVESWEASALASQAALEDRS